MLQPQALEPERSRNSVKANLERVAVIGSNGQLGSELLRAFADLDPIALDRTELDVEDPDSIDRAVAKHKPTFLIDTAAFHDVAKCEVDPGRAFAVNAVAVQRLAARANCGLAFISSDYVFEGTLGRPYTEADEPRPVNVYGASKLAGERAALAHPQGYVFRTAGLYSARAASGKRYTFVQRVLEQARTGEPIRVVDDITFSPSYAPHVAGFIRRILDLAPPGLYHTTNLGQCTWYEFAQAALRLGGYQRAIEAIGSSAFDPSVRRPAYSALEPAAARALGVPLPPPWAEGLADYVAAAGLGVPQPSPK